MFGFSPIIYRSTSSSLKSYYPLVIHFKPINPNGTYNRAHVKMIPWLCSSPAVPFSRYIYLYSRTWTASYAEKVASSKVSHSSNMNESPSVSKCYPLNRANTGVFPSEMFFCRL
ncbi:hypothetical protein OCU04_006887 [Sclerotinia nivalis]|uniref:Uncharacterized protein n=1 Tax=Sclerotinia nivalis TaxID=352851 RepID=A0A9X0AKP9_9HELO|nr:hypothetical protein OCU04_006887 [Sclerotinia nivalis]